MVRQHSSQYSFNLIHQINYESRSFHEIWLCFQSPHCVHEDKWNVLKDPSVDPEVLANVVIEIWDRLHTQMIAIGYALLILNI